MRWRRCIIGVVLIALPAGVNQEVRGQQAIADPAADLLEFLSDEVEVDPDVEDELRALLDAPLDVNTASVSALARIPGIDRTMAASLVQHRNMHGAFTAWETVAEVLGVGGPLSIHLRPFFVVGQRAPERSRQDRGVRAYAALQRFQRQDASILRMSGRSIRTEITRRSLLRLSIRDAAGLGGRLTVSDDGADTRTTIGGVQVSALNGRIAAIGGAFAAGIGSGLVLSGGRVRDKWQFAGGSQTSGALRIRPRGSATGDGALTGAALQFVVPNGPVVSGIYARRTSGAESVKGLALELQGTGRTVGLLLLAGSSAEIAGADPPLHALRRPRSGSWRTGSVYFDGGYGSLRMSLESVVASPGAGAVTGTIGVRSRTGRRVTLAYRWVSPRFPLRLGRPEMVVATNGTGERGLLIGASGSVGPWSLRFVADAFRRVWASAVATWPSPSYDLRIEAARRWRIVSGSVRYASRSDPADLTVADQVGRHLTAGSFVMRRSLRGQTDLRLSRRLSLRTRAELVCSRDPAGVRTHGTLLYQQIRWQPVERILVEARNVTFITTSSDARLYLHEGDVLYQPVLAVVSGEGERRYVRLRLDLGDHVTLEGKISALRQRPPATTSDAAPSVQRRTEMRFQLLLKP